MQPVSLAHHNEPCSLHLGGDRFKQLQPNGTVMTFAKPAFLYALLLLPLLLIFLYWTDHRRAAALARLGEPGLVKNLLSTVSEGSRRWKTALWFCAAALLLAALARPQWGEAQQPVERSGAQIMLALDVSTSMLAQDARPDRLARAQEALDEIVSGLDGAEVGLVLFSGASFLQLPLTSDDAALHSFLEAASPETVSRPGTSVSSAILTALRGFDPSRARPKAILLVSDGEAHDDDPLPAARQAAEGGVLVYTLGAGTADGALVPEYNTAGEVIGYKRAVGGELVVSRLNETLLRQVAAAGGGAYYWMDGENAVSSLTANLNRLQSAAYLAQVEKHAVERFQYLLLPALALLLAAELLPERKPGRSKAQKGGA